MEQKTTGISPLLVIFLLSGILGLIAAAVMLLAEQGQTSSALNDITRVRRVQDWQADEFQLMNLDGETVSLSDYAGRTVFLNFWRTDCPPCVKEMPDMQTFMQEQGESGAVVLAVNQGETPEQIQEFLAGIGVTEVPVLLDTDLVLSDNYPINGLPTTYVINGDGAVKYTKIGAFTLDEMNIYLEETQG